MGDPSPFPHERDQPRSRETWTLPPLAVWVSLAVLFIFSITFLVSLKEALVTINRTPLVTRFFYWVTYGSFYAWPCFTMIFMIRGRLWSFYSSQLVHILLMLGLAFIGVSTIAQGGPRSGFTGVACFVGLFLVLGVFLWNSGSRRVALYYGRDTGD